VIFGLTQQVNDTERFGQTLTLQEYVTLHRRKSCSVSEQLRNFQQFLERFRRQFWTGHRW